MSPCRKGVAAGAPGCGTASGRRALGRGGALVTTCALSIALATCERPDTRPEWRIPLTESFTLRSSSVQSDYEIMVALPRGYDESDETHPVLYVLDANGVFPVAVEVARFLTFDPLQEEPVIVGLGYPDRPFRGTLGPRIRDFTPTPDAEAVRALSERFRFAPSGSGGAAAFLGFLADELIPVVEGRYRIDEKNRALHSYSLGGLFATFVLFQRPDLFQSYLIGAPGLWWDGGAFWEFERSFAASGRELPARVLLSVGSMDAANLESVERLESVFRSRSYGGLVWQTQLLENETHNSAIPLSVGRGIRWLYGDLAPASGGAGDGGTG